MVYGIKQNTNGAIIVNVYDKPSEVPKDEIIKHPDELQDYLEKLAKGE